jgi:hypothetical protein
MKPILKGTFSTPSGQKIEALWYKDGLEEYLVDGERVLADRGQQTSFTRYFSAGAHQVKVEFSLLRFSCKAYVDGELVTSQVFEDFSKFHNWRESYWPSTDTWMGGVKATRQGFWAALSISVISIVLSIYSIRVSPILDDGAAVFILLQGLIFIPISVGFHKHSRVAATLGLGWYGLVQIVEILETSQLPNFLALMFILMLVNGTRGVFAVHRFPEPPDIDPSERVRSFQKDKTTAT